MEETIQDLLKKYRKKPLFNTADLTVPLQYGKTEIQRLIPHRDPLLFVDGIDAWDPEKGQMAGYRAISKEDPVFQGHFPEFPVYPGNFTVESIGQLGLCMYYFVSSGNTRLEDDAKPVNLRATKILGALFQEAILPGMKVQLLAQKLTWDGYFATMIGQALVDGKVAVVCAGEVMILQD